MKKQISEKEFGENVSGIIFKKFIDELRNNDLSSEIINGLDRLIEQENVNEANFKQALFPTSENL